MVKCQQHNTHMPTCLYTPRKQVVESIMCVFEDDILVKRAWLYDYTASNHTGGGGGGGGASSGNVDGHQKRKKGTLYEVLLPGNAQCRACFDMKKPDSVTSLQTEMLEYGCFDNADETVDEACRYYYCCFLSARGAGCLCERSEDRFLILLNLIGSIPCMKIRTLFEKNNPIQNQEDTPT